MPYNFLTVNARFVQRAPFPFSLPPPSRLPLKAVLPSCRRSLFVMQKQPFYEVKAAFSVIQKAALSHTEVAPPSCKSSLFNHTEAVPWSCKSSSSVIPKQSLRLYRNIPLTPNHSLANGHGVPRLLPHVLCIQP